MNLRLFSETLGELVVGEIKMAGTRVGLRLIGPKLFYVIGNGPTAEIGYDLRYLPDYIMERCTDKKNKQLVSIMAAALSSK